jgi:hypothetical protein
MLDKQERGTAAALVGGIPLDLAANTDLLVDIGFLSAMKRATIS